MLGIDASGSSHPKRKVAREGRWASIDTARQAEVENYFRGYVDMSLPCCSKCIPISLPSNQ